MELRDYTDEDIGLTAALECDPEVMRFLGGPIDPGEIPSIHTRRLRSAEDGGWWLVVVPEPGGPAAGTIGIWPGEFEGAPVNEVGWMLLPPFHGRGIGGEALGMVIARARREDRFFPLHAFPGEANPASNALCRRAGFQLVGTTVGGYAGSEFLCNHWIAHR